MYGERPSLLTQSDMRRNVNKKMKLDNSIFVELMEEHMTSFVTHLNI